MKKLSDRETEIMMVIWAADNVLHTGQILRELNLVEPRKLQPVQVFLRRLCEKEMVRCDKIGHLNFYTPIVDQETYRKFETHRFIQRLFCNSPGNLLLSLFRYNELDMKDWTDVKEKLEKDPPPAMPEDKQS